jgi:hypothetical protein
MSAARGFAKALRPRSKLFVWVTPASDLAKAKAVTASKKRPIWYPEWTFDSKHLLYLCAIAL